MLKYFFSSILTILLITKSEAQNYKPIITESIPITDDYFGTEITDEYRWLESTNSDKTKEWLEQQKDISKRYLRKASTKTNSFFNIDKYNYTKYKYYTKKGKYYFNMYHTSFASQASLFYKPDKKSDYTELINPRKISKDDVINFQNYTVSKNSKYLALKYGRNGTDWSEVKVITLKDKKILNDHIRGVKFSNITWLNDGFFYATYEQSDKFGESINNKVFYHKLGTTQSEDKLVFARKKDPYTTFKFSTTSDERFFIIKEENESTGKNSVFYIDYLSEKKVLKPLYYKVDFNINILDNVDGKLIAATYKDSNNGMLIKIDPKNPSKWETIAPNYSSAIILKVIPFSDRIVTIYQSDQKPILIIYDYNGKVLYKLDFPEGTSIGGFSGNKTDKELLFYLQSYTVPRVVYEFNIETFEKELVKKTGVTFKYKDIVYKRVEYISKDSVKVPMVLVHREDIQLNGINPTILKAYGGFGSVNSPSFNPGIVHFVRKGGVFAFANIRGGGDKGTQWAKDGKGDKKQNSFDDFIAAAEYLIKNDYTNSDKLAITGGSNGGLVTAVAAIQRPDLFKVAVPIVAPTDMIRFEKFTVGRFHLDEYGTVKDSLSFNRLKKYSPYHNIKKTTNYPAMLVITSENDDRVPPFHSYKFVAKLQSQASQLNPILLKVEKNAGHYGASTYRSNIKEMGDLYGFILYHLNP